MSINEKMTAIADAIRDKTGTTEKLGLDQMAEAVPQVYEAGRQAEYDAFWDNFQLDKNTSNGLRLHYAYAFAYGGWNDKNYNPKYPIVYSNISGISNMFVWNVHVSDTKVPITAYGSCTNAFANSNIKRIPKLIFSGATNVSNMFLNCTKLEELYCEGELTVGGLDLRYASKLNRASIESIVNVLSTATTGLSITLSETAVVNAFGNLDDEWSTVAGSRLNWNIYLA